MQIFWTIYQHLNDSLASEQVTVAKMMNVQYSKVHLTGTACKPTGE